MKMRMKIDLLFVPYFINIIRKYVFQQVYAIYMGESSPVLMTYLTPSVTPLSSCNSIVIWGKVLQFLSRI
jgi:hypothetical protein